MTSDVPIIFIQARMSSERFPGKVLAPFCGVPMILHVVKAAQEVVGVDRVVVLTSDLPSDAPLVSYLKAQGISCFCGSLENVFDRFSQAVEAVNASWFVRLSGDSPLMDSGLIEYMAGLIENYSDADVITNVFPRSFPKGHSIEIFKARTFLGVEQESLSVDEREHVAPFFYKNVKEYKIIGVVNTQDQSGVDLSVDTLEDYERLQGCDSSILYDYSSFTVTQRGV